MARRVIESKFSSLFQNLKDKEIVLGYNNASNYDAWTISDQKGAIAPNNYDSSILNSSISN